MKNHAVNSFIVDSPELYQMLDFFPGSVYCKDKQGKYVAVNKVQMLMNGTADILGRKDSDLSWHQQASALLHNDRKVIHEEAPFTFIEPCVTSDKKLRCFSEEKSFSKVGRNS